jgi:hypothetical protein
MNQIIRKLAVAAVAALAVYPAMAHPIRISVQSLHGRNWVGGK